MAVPSALIAFALLNSKDGFTIKTLLGVAVLATGAWLLRHKTHRSIEWARRVAVWVSLAQLIEWIPGGLLGLDRIYFGIARSSGYIWTGPDLSLSTQFHIGNLVHGNSATGIDGPERWVTGVVMIALTAFIYKFARPLKKGWLLRAWTVLWASINLSNTLSKWAAGGTVDLFIRTYPNGHLRQAFSVSDLYGFSAIAIFVIWLVYLVIIGLVRLSKWIADDLSRLRLSTTQVSRSS